MPLPDAFLQELVSRNPIEDVVSSYVRTTQRGRTFVGLCPFHGEKTPSFTVYPETTSFYCFGCSAGGDVITFIKKIENLGYVDAVRFLADRAGMKMPREDVDDTTYKLRIRILEANRDAARFYHNMLYTPNGRAGLDYYYKRGYSDKTIKRFGLGYAPDSFALLNEMRKKGYNDVELAAAFLSKKSTRSGGYYDVFRNRIIVPIIDIRGNVVAFGGRVLDNSEPKYINTSDTLVYKKTNGLFALNFAKAAKGDSLILCEGYMDVITLHQAGFTNAIAALGTSFTEEHARLLSRYAREAILVFDSDSAGKKGAQRAISLLRKTGVHIRVITIPEGKDPDEFIRIYGPQRFKLLMERSANDIEYQLIELGRLHSLNTSDGKVLYLKEAASLLSRLNSPIERDVYAGRLAEELSVHKQAILDQIMRYKNIDKRQRQKKELSGAVKNSEQFVQKANPDAKNHLRAARAEEELLGLLLLHPDYIDSVSQKLAPEHMVTKFNRELYNLLIKRRSSGQMTELSFLASDYKEDEMSYITRMVHNAKDSAHTPDNVIELAGIIENENKFSVLQNPALIPDDKINEILEALRSNKK